MSFEVIVAQIKENAVIHFGEATLVESSVPPVIYCDQDKFIKPGKKVRTGKLHNGQKVWEQDPFDFLPSNLPIQELGVNPKAYQPLTGCLRERLVHVYSEQMGFDKNENGIISDSVFYPNSTDLRKLLLFGPIDL